MASVWSQHLFPGFLKCFFAPAIAEERTKRQMVGDLLERAFGGSVHELVVQALGARKVTAAELRDIRKLLNELDPKP